MPLPARVEARLAGSGGPPEPLREAIPFERRASEPGAEPLRLRLPAAGLPIASIEVGVPSGNVLREARDPRVAPRRRPSRAVRAGRGDAPSRRAGRRGGGRDDDPSRRPRPKPSWSSSSRTRGTRPSTSPRVTALFEGLPWIYFESADGSPLSARFGAVPASRPPLRPRGAAPGDHAGRGPVALGRELGRPAARGGRRAPAATGAGVPPGAALDLAGFRVSRPIPPGPAGLTALRLDAAVLAASPQLSDVRIATADGRQVPYLLETLGEPLVVKLPAPQRADDPRPRSGPGEARRVSFHRLELPFDRLPAARLELETTARVFTRRVALLARGSAAAPRPPGRSSRSPRRRGRPPTPIATRPRSFSTCRRTRGRELFVSIDDGDNAALPLGQRLAPPPCPAPPLRAGGGGRAEARLRPGGSCAAALRPRAPRAPPPRARRRSRPRSRLRRRRRRGAGGEGGAEALLGGARGRGRGAPRPRGEAPPARRRSRPPKENGSRGRVDSRTGGLPVVSARVPTVRAARRAGGPK